MPESPVVFVHIPKSAGTSIRGSLAGHLGLKRCHFHYGDLYPDVSAERPAFVSGHCSAMELLKCYPGARLITCLREPVARLLSLAAHLRRAPGGSGDWYRAKRPSLLELASADKSTLVRGMRWFLDVPPQGFACILRFESLATDWPRACEVLGLPDLPLGHLNPTADAREYNPREVELARRLLVDETRCYERYARIGSKRLHAR